MPVPRRFDRRPPEQDLTRVNERIAVQEVRLIDERGQQVGVLKTAEALRFARERDLDLVEVAPQASPPVARVLDYSKYKYEQAQKQKQARKHQQQITIREIKFRPKIAQHDYDTKKGHVERFLLSKYKVKVTIMFRGREVSHPERGVAILDRLAGELSELGVVEQSPSLEGRNMAMLMAPSKGVLSGQVTAARHGAEEAAAADGGAGPDASADASASPPAGADGAARDASAPQAGGAAQADGAPQAGGAATSAAGDSGASDREPAASRAPGAAADATASTDASAPVGAQAAPAVADERPKRAAAPATKPRKAAVAKQPSDDAAEQPAKQPSDGSAEQPAKQPSDEAPKQPAKQRSDDAAKQPAKQPSDEATKQPAKPASRPPARGKRKAPA